MKMYLFWLCVILWAVLFLSSCSSQLRMQWQEDRVRCVERMLNQGMKPESAEKACGWVIRRM